MGEIHFCCRIFKSVKDYALLLIVNLYYKTYEFVLYYVLECLACNIHFLCCFHYFPIKLYFLVACVSTEYFKVISKQVTADTKKDIDLSQYKMKSWDLYKALCVKLC